VGVREKGPGKEGKRRKGGGRGGRVRPELDQLFAYLNGPGSERKKKELKREGKGEKKKRKGPLVGLTALFLPVLYEKKMQERGGKKREGEKGRGRHLRSSEASSLSLPPPEQKPEKNMVKGEGKKGGKVNRSFHLPLFHLHPAFSEKKGNLRKGKKGVSSSRTGKKKKTWKKRGRKEKGNRLIVYVSYLGPTRHRQGGEKKKRKEKGKRGGKRSRYFL